VKVITTKYCWHHTNNEYRTVLMIFEREDLESRRLRDYLHPKLRKYYPNHVYNFSILTSEMIKLFNKMFEADPDFRKYVLRRVKIWLENNPEAN